MMANPMHRLIVGGMTGLTGCYLMMMYLPGLQGLLFGAICGLLMAFMVATW